jgi:uncharacterized protein (TIGR02271 family)
MALVSLKDTYPDYRETFSDNSLGHIDDYTVYTEEGDKVGSVEDGLFDDTTGQFRYLVIDTGSWIFGKKVLLPIGRAQFDNNQQRVNVRGLTKKQVEDLPEYDRNKTVDYEHEESVRGVYREPSYRGTSVEQTLPVDESAVYGAAGAPVDAVAGSTDGAVGSGYGRDAYAPDGSYSGNAYAPSSYTADSYTYDRDPDLYDMDRENNANQTIRLYEERLIADKTRMKRGDVSIGKHVETESASVSVPVERERVVIERTAPVGRKGSVGDHVFEDGEVANVEIYEEQANVRKEAFVREEVRVRKETQRDTVTEQANIRREELDVDADDDTLINRSADSVADRPVDRSMNDRDRLL